MNVAKRVRKKSCDTVVYASTFSTCGSRTGPSLVDMDVEAPTAYEASKFARERYAEHYANHHKIQSPAWGSSPFTKGLAATRSTKVSM